MRSRRPPSIFSPSSVGWWIAPVVATAGAAFSEVVWNFFAPRMGGAQRLPNGNTLITESSFGRFFEVTQEGEIVWEYVNPFFGKPLFGGREGSVSDQVFRAYRYSAEGIALARTRS